MREAVKLTGTGIGGSGGAAERRVREVLIQGHSHLFPFSAVKQTTNVCSEWLRTEMMNFRNQEAVWDQKRAAMSARDHLTLPSKWMEVVKPLSACKGKL